MGRITNIPTGSCDCVNCADSMLCSILSDTSPLLDSTNSDKRQASAQSLCLRDSQMLLPVMLTSYAACVEPTNNEARYINLSM